MKQNASHNVGGPYVISWWSEKNKKLAFKQQGSLQQRTFGLKQ